MNPSSYPLPNDQEKMEWLSERTGGDASVPIDFETGEVLHTVLKECVERNYGKASTGQQRDIFSAALAAHEISSTGYLDFMSGENIPDVSNFEFSDGMELLPLYLHNKFMQIGKTSFEEALRKVRDLAIPLLEGNYYAPYFQNGEQVDITNLVNEKAKEVLDLLENKKSHFFVLPRLMQINYPMTRAWRIPFYIPANSRPRDFDSGDCNVLSRTSFALGEPAWLIARSGFDALVESNNRVGWTSFENLIDARDIPRMQETPQTFIDKFYRSGPPYMHSVWDCSEAIRTSLGVPLLSKFSGDMCDDLHNRFEHADVYSPDRLNRIINYPGVYIMQMLKLEKSRDGLTTERSLHMEVVTITRNHEFKSRSVAFNAVDKDGNVTYPVGAVTRDLEDIRKHLNLESGDRMVRFYKLTA